MLACSSLLGDVVKHLPGGVVEKAALGDGVAKLSRSHAKVAFRSRIED